jgi:hypothetical protein
MTFGSGDVISGDVISGDVTAPPQMRFELSLYTTHKCSLKQRYIAGSAKCPTKRLSKLLISILSVVKTGHQSYCDTSYSRGGVNRI